MLPFRGREKDLEYSEASCGLEGLSLGCPLGLLRVFWVSPVVVDVHQETDVGAEALSTLAGERLVEPGL